MKNKSLFIGLILFFGLCITMLSKGTDAYAAENEAKLNVSNVAITVEGTYKLKVYNLQEGQSVSYRSSDSAVATVSKSGKVTGISCGNAVITAVVMEKDAPVVSLQCDVLIGPAAVSIKLTKTELVLSVGKTKSLKTIIFPINTVEEPTFYSADTSIAKVSSAGRVRAVTAGAVQIYAFIANGQSSVCNVTVLNEEDYDRYLEGVSLEEILAEQEDAEAPETDDETVEVQGAAPVAEGAASETGEKSEKSEDGSTSQSGNLTVPNLE